MNAIKKAIDKCREAELASKDAHVATLTSCVIQHEALADAYEDAFAAWHAIAEHSEAVEPSYEQTIDEAYAALEEARAAVGDAIKGEKDEGMKNVLITAYEKLTMRCAKLRSAMPEEEEAEDANEQD